MSDRAQRIMTNGEREEYDQLLYEAGYDDNGKARPSHEIGPRVLEALHKAADQAHRTWARYVLDDIAAAGALARFRSWSRTRNPITVAGQTYVATKPAAMSVRRTNADGETYFQATFWDDMTRDDLAQLIQRTAKDVESEQRTIAVARRLIEALDRAPQADVVSEAMTALGTTTQEYLATPEGKAA